MGDDDKIEELEHQILELERELALHREYLTKILNQIPEIPERGMARFDAVTWESPSEVHTTFLAIDELAKKSPDGYTTKKRVKKKLASEHDYLKSHVSEYFKRLKEEEMIEEHPGDSSRIKPVEDISAEDGKDLFVSNFDQADARRDKAERRGKRRDRRR